MPHRETHRVRHMNWLRAAVLGANDGLISTSSLVIGVVSAGADRSAALIAAAAGMIAGALSMAAGEYVSVSSQADTEQADLSLERRELADRPEAEQAELTRLYMSRGLERELASRVADALTSHDALDAHARDELGIHGATRARPLQAAMASAAAFTLGALPPVLLTALLPVRRTIYVLVPSTLVALLALGGSAARMGGAPWVRGALRVAFWGALAMGITALVGKLFGTAI